MLLYGLVLLAIACCRWVYLSSVDFAILFDPD